MRYFFDWMHNGLTALSSRRWVAAVVIPLAGLLIFVGWIGVPYSPASAITSGRAKIPCVQQFDRLFPSAEHFISYFTGTHGPSTWNAEVGLYGRYLLTMQVPIGLNAMHNRITSYGQPLFVLAEVKSVSGSVVTNAGGMSFGPGEWQRVVDAGGDLSVLGMAMVKDQPITGFKQALSKR
jgi:hypothetical protein